MSVVLPGVETAPLRRRLPASRSGIVAAILSLKGGPGKSTIINHLGHGLALRGFAVFMGEIEDNMRLWELNRATTDRAVRLQQALTTYALLTEPELGADVSSMSRILLPQMIEAVQGLSKPDLMKLRAQRGWTAPQMLDFLPGHESIRRLENQFTLAAKSAVGMFHPYTQLAHALDTMRDAYDVLLLDTPPSQALIQFNAVMAADWVILVVDFDQQSLGDIDRTLRFYEEVCQAARSLDRQPPRVLGVVYNKYDDTFTDNDVPLLRAYTEHHLPLDEDGKETGDLQPPLIPFAKLGVIRYDRRRLVAAQNRHQTLHTWAPTSEIGKDFAALCDTVERTLDINTYA